MAVSISINLTPGRTVCWQRRRFVVADHTGFDIIRAREIVKRRIERIPIRQLKPGPGC